MYPVDDVFIHMQMAKNLALHGSWGINANEFGSASSSLLYTVLLATAFKIFSVSVYLPFMINCLAGVGLITVVCNWLARQGLSTLQFLLVMAALVFFVPLPIVIVSGMEHTLQCLFSFLLLFHSAGWMEEGNASSGKKPSWPLPLYAMLLTATRYEGLFLVAAVCLVMLFRKKFLPAFVIGSASLLPLLAFGILSLSKGSYFLPNSVLVKSQEVPLFGGGIAHFFDTLFIEKLTFFKPGITLAATQRLLLILPAVFLLFASKWKLRPGYAFVLIALTICTFLHLALASTGKFYRYEAYLVLCACLSVFTCVFKFGSSVFGSYRSPLTWIACLLFFFLFLPLVLRSTAAYTKATRACINIYEQQYQMGRFLKEHYPASVVAANDIGAISFYTSDTIADLWGLANIEVTKSRREKYWTPSFLDQFSRRRGAKMAMIYDSWFDPALGSKWQKLASWQIRDNVVCGDDTVSFYALDSASAPEIMASLRSFASSLPPTVTVHYFGADGKNE